MPPISSCPIVQFTRAPPPARGATAGSRSLLTRLSSAKTSVILYDKKMGAPAASPRRSPSRQIYRTARTHSHTSAARQPAPAHRIERNQSNEVGMMARGTLVSRLGWSRSSSPLRTPGHHRVGVDGREGGVGMHHFARAGPSKEASAIDCFLHHKAMVKSKHVKANHDVRSSVGSWGVATAPPRRPDRSLGGGLLPPLSV